MSISVVRPPATKGWCPGALRPMQSGDGLIVRLRLTSGILHPALAADIARWSRQWGNGQIDLSNRANLQLRGLSSRNLPALLGALAEAGLLDDSPAAEAVRNVIASPLAGLDPTALLDIRPIVAGLERRLASDPSLHALPGKFGFSIDDGGLFGLDDVAADVRFKACPGPAFIIHLAGSPDSFGPCQPDALPEVAAKIARAFLRHPNARRMRDLAAEIIAREAGLTPAPACPDRPPHPDLGAHALNQRSTITKPLEADKTSSWPNETSSWPGLSGPPFQAQARCDSPDKPSHNDGSSRRLLEVMCPAPKPVPRACFAGYDTRTGGQPTADAAIPSSTPGIAAFLGIGLPFGRMTAEDLAELAAAAVTAGAQEFRLTPWRAIIIPLPSLNAAHTLAAQLPAHAFILDPNDPRRRIAACPGTPACTRATTHTRDDAGYLADHLPPGSGITIHLSGCEKGCAHPHVAAITLVGRNGRYDLVRDGTASSSPMRHGLTPAQVAEHIP